MLLLHMPISLIDESLLCLPLIDCQNNVFRDTGSIQRRRPILPLPR